MINDKNTYMMNPIYQRTSKKKTTLLPNVVIVPVHDLH